VVEANDADRLRELIGALHPKTGRARVVGLTGPPGVGKSTLVNSLVGELCARGRTVAVLAVDPSSPFTGGALLGDRIRMQAHSGNPGVFIRSMASRGRLGGLSAVTAQALTVVDAAGFDDVIVETVGVGQSEVEIATLADTTVVVLAPGLGDGVQAAKAGVLEVADVFVVNKADQPGAGKTVAELRGTLAPSTGSAGIESWVVPIIRTVGVRPTGVAELADAIDTHERHLDVSGDRMRRVRARALHAIREISLDQVRRTIERFEDDSDSALGELADGVAARVLDPYVAADKLIEALGMGASSER
jgi:LAO/AO transport system kinase